MKTFPLDEKFFRTSATHSDLKMFLLQPDSRWLQTFSRLLSHISKIFKLKNKHAPTRYSVFHDYSNRLENLTSYPSCQKDIITTPEYDTTRATFFFGVSGENSDEVNCLQVYQCVLAKKKKIPKHRTSNFKNTKRKKESGPESNRTLYDQL